MLNTTKQFILVDDDPLNNFLSKIVIQKLFEKVEVKDFVIPELALEYINSNFEQLHQVEKTTLLLDINMPSLSGWEFLEVFEKFTNVIKNHFNIYMLSSSVDPSDIQRAKLNPLIIDFIEKPLNRQILSKLFV